MTTAEQIELIYTTAAAYHGIDVVLLMRKDLATWHIRADVYRLVQETLPITEAYHYLGISKAAFERTLALNPKESNYNDLKELTHRLTLKTLKRA
jgi:hypothetical protein